MILSIGAAQQMKIDEAWDVAQMRVTRRPDLLEIHLGSGNDLEAVHRDKHGLALGLPSARSCYIAGAASRPLPPALRSSVAGDTGRQPYERHLRQHHRRYRDPHLPGFVRAGHDQQRREWCMAKD